MKKLIITILLGMIVFVSLGVVSACRTQNDSCSISNEVCCSGLTAVGLCERDNDGLCLCANCGTVCLPCGNGICDSGENKCNCPEDCGNKTQTCAKENEMFSKVYSEYPKTCCEGEGLIEWDSGMDTREVKEGKCAETGRLAGAPVGTCIKCGDGICGEKENLCNCPADCGEKQQDEKSCTKDSDCSVNYGVWYNNRCSAGCFNKNTSADSRCNDIKFELMTNKCNCINNVCIHENENPNQNKTCAVANETFSSELKCCPGLKADKDTSICIMEGKKVGWFKNFLNWIGKWFSRG